MGRLPAGMGQGVSCAPVTCHLKAEGCRDRLRFPSRVKDTIHVDMALLEQRCAAQGMRAFWPTRDPADNVTVHDVVCWAVSPSPEDAADLPLSGLKQQEGGAQPKDSARQRDRTLPEPLAEPPPDVSCLEVDLDPLEPTALPPVPATPPKSLLHVDPAVVEAMSLSGGTCDASCGNSPNRCRSCGVSPNSTELGSATNSASSLDLMSPTNSQGTWSDAHTPQRKDGGTGSSSSQFTASVELSPQLSSGCGPSTENGLPLQRGPPSIELPLPQFEPPNRFAMVGPKEVRLPDESNLRMARVLFADMLSPISEAQTRSLRQSNGHRRRRRSAPVSAALSTRMVSLNCSPVPVGRRASHSREPDVHRCSLGPYSAQCTPFQPLNGSMPRFPPVHTSARA